MELHEALLDPRAYPHHPAEVSTTETHISWIYFAGDEVFKVKKPVSLGFLDFSTLDLRRHFCEEEVRLNRRLAPSVYLGVVGIHREPDGRLRVGEGSGPAIEYAVRMRRLPEHRMLEHLLDVGEVDNEMMNVLAEVLAGFHARVETGGAVDDYGRRESIARTSRENFERCAPFAGGDGPQVASRELVGFLEGWIDAFLARHAALFDARVARGRIREGHGDLHAGNICLEGPGTAGVAIFDCIEFDPRFRCVDVAADLAFLLMDLDLRGFRGFGGYLLKRYGELARDGDLEVLMDFYKLERSLVRGMVAALQTRDAPPERLDAVVERASGYFQLAASYALGPVLIATCGLPGSGKSRLAHSVQAPFEAVLINSDATRKQLCGIAPEQPAGDAAYTADMTAATYRRMGEHAERALDRGRSVILDAGHRRRAQRAAVTRLAAERGVPLCWLEPEVDDATIRERLARRVRSPTQASDADLGVYESLLRSYQRPNEIPAALLCRVVPDTPPRDIRARVIDALIGGAGPAA